MTGFRGISRRQVLTIAAGAAGASITGATAVIGTSTPAQAAEVSQKIVIATAAICNSLGEREMSTPQAPDVDRRDVADGS